MPSARILVLDDDTDVTQFVADTLAPDGFEILTAHIPSEAVSLVKVARFDLVILDVDLPEMTGFQFRAALRKHPGHERTPVLFLSAASPTTELEIARSLGGDTLLLKPLAPLELRRAVAVKLGVVRSDKGPIPAALDRILAAVAADRETGILTAVAGTTVKRVVFQDGKVAFAASNDPREVIGQVFVRSGLITEKDLSAAFSYRDSAPSPAAPLGVVLTALRKVTPQQCQKIFESKVREAVLDLFLWKGGVVEYAAGGVLDAEKPFPMKLELPPLRVEGLKRRIKWAEVQRLLPDPSVRFERPGGKWPADFPKTDGDRLLAQHVEAGRSMAEILVELRGQDFAVGARLADLVKAGALQSAASSGFVGARTFDSVSVDIDEELAAYEREDEDGATFDDGEGVEYDTSPGFPSSPQKSTRVLEPIAAPVVVPGFQSPAFSSSAAFAPSPAFARATPDTPVEPDVEDPSEEEAPTVGMLTRALVLFRAGDLLGAREGLVEVLTADPSNPLARQRIQQVDEALAAAAVQGGLHPDARVSLGVPLEKLVGQAIGPNDAFVLTRLAGGALSVADLVRICPLPSNEVMEVIQRYLASGVLTLN